MNTAKLRHRITLAILAASLACIPSWHALAYDPPSGTWVQSGYTLNGFTNQFADRTLGGQPGCPIQVCGGTPQFYADSFSNTPNGGVWVAAYQQAGDRCADGTGSYTKASNGWNWLFNAPNQNVKATTGWLSAETCDNHGGGHSYLAQAYHNLQTPSGAAVNFTGGTAMYRGA